MRVEVDQSGKIEQLNCDTAVAFSNNTQYAVLLPKSLKRDIFLRYKSRIPRLKYKLFCICVYHCIKNLVCDSGMIVIDDEYKGNENVIKSLLMNYIRATCKEFEAKRIAFGRIGKSSNAHITAIGVFRKQRRADKVLSLEDAEFFFKSPKEMRFGGRHSPHIPS